jgi:CubicO group peptidase (beta-lactamase class C family)
MNLLPASSPAAQGVLAEGIEVFLDALESAPEVEPHSLMVLRHGYVVAAGWWWPYTADRPHLLYSLSKIFTATATGLAVGEGLVGLDDPVVSYFPELASRVTDRRARSMLVRHLASMASGHTEDTAGRVFGTGDGDPVLNFLLVPPEREPGSVFAYNQPATYTLAAIVQRATGGSLVHYLRRRLFDKLGATELSWLQSPPGRDIGYSGLYATTETVALLGQLYLQGGKWQGEQLLARSWVREATRAQVPTRIGDASGAMALTGDGALGYGYQFWMSQHGYRGDGAYGQYCLVLPDEDAVVVMTAQTRSAGRPAARAVLTCRRSWPWSGTSCCRPSPPTASWLAGLTKLFGPGWTASPCRPWAAARRLRGTALAGRARRSCLREARAGPTLVEGRRGPQWRARLAHYAVRGRLRATRAIYR